jgi:predicted small metal-binding protein
MQFRAVVQHAKNRHPFTSILEEEHLLLKKTLQIM